MSIQKKSCVREFKQCLLYERRKLSRASDPDYGDIG